MGDANAPRTGLAGIDLSTKGLPVPTEGLHEVLKAWSGKAQLWDAVAMIVDDSYSERRWTRRDVERRAHRVLFARLLPSLAGFPSRVSAWLDSLPAETVRAREVTQAPNSGTSWPRTRITFGWPPTGFTGRVKSRVADTLLVTTLRWVADSLLPVWSDALSVDSTVDRAVRGQVESLRALTRVDPLASAVGTRPYPGDLKAILHEGAPWIAVARVAQELLELDNRIDELALSLLMPDPDVDWRLFHLGVLGVLLKDLRKAGAALTSLRPLSGTTPGPAYEVIDAAGRKWDLWFEAASIWTYYKARSPYVEATKGLGAADSPLSPDIMLVRPGDRALIIECKYSKFADRVGRQGLLQAMSYATEASTALAPWVESVVIAPDGVVTSPTLTQTVSGQVGLSSPSTLEDSLRRLLS